MLTLRVWGGVGRLAGVGIGLPLIFLGLSLVMTLKLCLDHTEINPSNIEVCVRVRVCTRVSTRVCSWEG